MSASPAAGTAAFSAPPDPGDTAAGVRPGGAAAGGPLGGAGIAGVVSVALLLAAERWGAYLGIPRRHLFLTDLLLVGATVTYLARLIRRAGGRVSLTAGRPFPLPLAWPGLGVVVLLGVGAFRYALGSAHGAMALRDAAPWGYAVVAFLSAQAVATASERARRWARNLLVGALIVHLVWVAVMLGLPDDVRMSLPAAGPGAPVLLLELRADIDSALLAVLACWGVSRLWRGEGRTWWWMGLSVASFVALLQLSSRVGPLAAMLCTGIALIAGRGSARPGMVRRAGLMALLAVAVAGVSALLPSSPSGTRLVGSVTPQAAPTTTAPPDTALAPVDPSSPGVAPSPAPSVSVSAPWPAPSSTRRYTAPKGTMRAREKTWRLVRDYTLVSPQRAIFGVGFGPNIVREAGATGVIGETSDSDVRSPHNFPLTVFARTGVVGLLALAGFLLALGRAAGRTVRAPDDLRLLGLLVIAALSVGSLVGVVMEAPFGAVPVYWCAGVLLSRPWRWAPTIEHLRITGS